MKGEKNMHILGMPISVASLFVITVIVIPVISETVLHSKWWKDKSEYYFAFNNVDENEKKE